MTAAIFAAAILFGIAAHLFFVLAYERTSRTVVADNRAVGYLCLSFGSFGGCVAMLLIGLHRLGVL